MPRDRRLDLLAGSRTDNCSLARAQCSLQALIDPSSRRKYLASQSTYGIYTHVTVPEPQRDVLAAILLSK
jgi:hypothetical protein